MISGCQFSKMISFSEICMSGFQTEFQLDLRFHCEDSKKYTGVIGRAFFPSFTQLKWREWRAFRAKLILLYLSDLSLNLSTLVCSNTKDEHEGVGKDMCLSLSTPSCWSFVLAQTSIPSTMNQLAQQVLLSLSVSKHFVCLLVCLRFLLSSSLDTACFITAATAILTYTMNRPLYKKNPSANFSQRM